MKKRFIICINNSTKDQEEEFIEFLRGKKVLWWHWLTNTWLVIDSEGKLNASYLRGHIVKIFKQEHSIVFELKNNEDTWAGFGPNGLDRNMFKWIKENWKKV